MLRQLFMNGIITGSIYALVAASFALIYQTTRFFHFAHGGIYTAGAYFAYMLSVPFGLPKAAAVAIAVIAGAGMGVFCDYAVYRPLRKRRASAMALLLASLGVLVVLQNTISMFFGDDLKTMRSRHVAEGISILGANITMVQLGILGATSVAFFALWLVLYRTSLGLQVRAVANDAELARIAGTSPDKTITWVFAIGSALAAGAAILISFDTDLTPNMGFQALLMGMIAAIVGGIGSLWGTVLGAFFLGLVRHLAVWKLPGQWQDAIVFLVLITFLLFRPNGFLGGGRRPRSF